MMIQLTIHHYYPSHVLILEYPNVMLLFVEFLPKIVLHYFKQSWHIGGNKFIFNWSIVFPFIFCDWTLTSDHYLLFYSSFDQSDCSIIFCKIVNSEKKNLEGPPDPPSRMIFFLIYLFENPIIHRISPYNFISKKWKIKWRKD